MLQGQALLVHLRWVRALLSKVALLLGLSLYGIFNHIFQPFPMFPMSGAYPESNSFANRCPHKGGSPIALEFAFLDCLQCLVPLSLMNPISQPTAWPLPTVFCDSKHQAPAQNPTQSPITDAPTNVRAWLHNGTSFMVLRLLETYSYSFSCLEQTVQ